MAVGLRRQGNLRAEITSFVGRESDITEVCKLLSEARLVTLTGVGGVGKTRLALQVGVRLGRMSASGVWLVELAPLHDGALISHTLLQTLGIHAVGDTPVAVLTEFLRDRDLLLIVDNCEHLIEPAADLLGLLLRSAPRLRILATSREALRIAGEHWYRVEPLTLPDRNGSPPDRRAAHHAVELFAERATAAIASFAVTEDNYADVVDVCRRLDGIPLAIELAAVRLRVLSLRQLRSRLDDRLRALGQVRRAGPPRHQTLRATVDWSYELCGPAERRLWMLASVFAGGFDLESIEEMWAWLGWADGHDETLDLLDRLVGKSILTCEQRDGYGWYQLLDILGDYGRERLRTEADEPRVRQAHARYYQRIAEQADREWFGHRQGYWLRRLRHEHGNVRAALDLLLSEGDTEAALGMAADLWFHWLFGGRVLEGQLWLGRALADATGPTVLRARALFANSMLAATEGKVDIAGSMADEARDLAERLGDPVVAAAAIYRQATAPTWRGDTTAAEALLTDALNRLAALGAGETKYGVLARNMLGACRGQRGDLAGAAEPCREAVAICERHGDEVLRSITLISWAGAELRAGRPAVAMDLTRDSMRLMRSMHVPINLAQAVEQMAWLTAARAGPGDHRRAAVLLGAADRIRREHGLTKLLQVPYYLDPHRKCETTVRAAIGSAALRTAFDRGVGMDTGEIISLAVGDGPLPDDGGPSAADDSGRLAALTRRERQVAELIAEGLTNRQIALRLVISQRTAESHVEHIMTKLGFRARTQVAAWMAATHADRADVSPGTDFRGRDDGR